MARFARFPITGLFLIAGICPTAALAQQTAPELTNVDKLTSAWFAVTNTLEPRVTRMLPCDPRVRTAIDEVSRASGERTAAINIYWQSRSAQSRAQIDVLRKLQSRLIDDTAEWKTDSADAQQEQAGVSGMAATLTDSAKRRPALNAALASLTEMSQQSANLAKLTAERETSGAALNQQILDFIAAAQARQTAIEAEQKAAAAEGARWTAYYATRLTRAQTECAITGQAPPPRPAPRPAPAAPAGKKQP